MVEVQMVMVPVTMRGDQHKVCIWMTLEAYYNCEWSNLGTVNVWLLSNGTTHNAVIHCQITFFSLKVTTTERNMTEIESSCGVQWQRWCWQQGLSKRAWLCGGLPQWRMEHCEQLQVTPQWWLVYIETQLTINVWTHILRHDREMKVFQSQASYTGEQMLTRIEHPRGKGFAPRLPKRDKRRHTYSSCICLNSERRFA